MTLPASGQISLNQVNVELGNSGTAQIDMGSSAVRGLFGVASGAIDMADGYGKANWSQSGTLIANGHVIGSSGSYSLTNTQAGDIIISMSGALTTSDPVQIPGFTNVWVYQSPAQWNTGSSTYYCVGAVQYKILNGTETSITHGIPNGAAVFHQYRFNNAISSVSTGNLDYPTQGGNYSIGSINYAARTAQPEAVLRMGGWMGYGAQTGATYNISNIDTGYSMADSGLNGSAYSRMVSAPSFGSTTIHANISPSTANSFRGTAVFVTLVLT